MAESKEDRLRRAIIDEMLVPAVPNGIGKKIFFYKDMQGTVLAQDFLKRLLTNGKVARTAHRKYWEYFSLHAGGHHIAGEKWHWLENNMLGEYKHHRSQTRLFHLADQDWYVVLDGITGKKEKKLNPGGVKRALDIRSEYFKRCEKLGRTIR